MPLALNFLMFISLMRNLMQDSLNKTNNRYILLGQVPTKTLTFFMICALRNKQVMPSGSWVIIPIISWTKRNRKSIRGIGYENNLKIDNRTVFKLRSGVAFVQQSHPTFEISVMMTELNTACSHAKTTTLRLLNKGNVGFSSVTYL